MIVLTALTRGLCLLVLLGLVALAWHAHRAALARTRPKPSPDAGGHVRVLSTYRTTAEQLERLDTWSSASRQHFIDTGSYLPAQRER